MARVAEGGSDCSEKMGMDQACNAQKRRCTALLCSGLAVLFEISTDVATEITCSVRARAFFFVLQFIRLLFFYFR